MKDFANLILILLSPCFWVVGVLFLVLATFFPNPAVAIIVGVIISGLAWGSAFAIGEQKGKLGK